MSIALNVLLLVQREDCERLFVFVRRVQLNRPAPSSPVDTSRTAAGSGTAVRGRVSPVSSVATSTPSVSKALTSKNWTPGIAAAPPSHTKPIWC